MGMRAGLLREVISITAPVVTRNDYGDEVTTYQPFATTRARVVFRYGSRGDINHEVQNPYTVEFLIRTHLDINPKMLITWRGNSYRIVTINYEQQRQQQTIVGEVVNE